MSIAGDGLVIIGENFNATRKIKMSSPRVVQQDGKVGIGTTAPAQTFDVAGNARVSGTFTAGPGQTGTPVAFGTFRGSDAFKYTGSANISCTWDAGSRRYECPISGYQFNTIYFVVNVTPIGFASIPYIDSVNNNMLINFSNLSGSGNVQPSSFSVTVYRP